VRDGYANDGAIAASSSKRLPSAGKCSKAMAALARQPDGSWRLCSKRGHSGIRHLAFRKEAPTGKPPKC
jgi:hypothetical protein